MCDGVQGVVSRELVQLEDLLKWSERGLGEEDEGGDIVAEALLVREEANKVVQVSGSHTQHTVAGHNTLFDTTLFHCTTATVTNHLQNHIHFTHTVQQMIATSATNLSFSERIKTLHCMVTQYIARSSI